MPPLARTEQILTESVGSELILYDQASKKAHRLNATAAFLWRHCDGTRGSTELAELLHREMGIAPEEGLVALALEQLQKQGLLLKSEAVATGLTRREAIARLKALGVAAAMIPVIATIAAPAPAAAASRSSFNTNRTATHSFFDDFWGKKGPKPSENGNNTKNSGNGSGLGPWQNP